MVSSFLQCELKALSAVRVEPGAGRRSSLRDEVEPLNANRSVRPAALATASRARVLATFGEVRSPKVKVTVATTAASDEPLGPFSAAILATLFLVTESDIQAA